MHSIALIIGLALAAGNGDDSSPQRYAVSGSMEQGSAPDPRAQQNIAPMDPRFRSPQGELPAPPNELAPDPPATRPANSVGVTPAAFEHDSPAGSLREGSSATGAEPRRLDISKVDSATYTADSSLYSKSTGNSSASHDSSIPLNLDSHSGHGGHDKPASLNAVITVGSSLAIVLGLFFVIAWAMRKAAPRGSRALPSEVFEILGRAPLGGRQQVHLLRCGGKLLLVSITPAGVETLTEVTDPIEVDRMSGLCRQTHPQSSTTAFRQVFQQFAPRYGRPSLSEREIEDLLETRTEAGSGYRWEEKNV